MSTEYIWFKKGREHRRTTDPEGKLPSSIRPTPNTEIRYEYRGDGSLSGEEYYKDGELHRDGDKPAYIDYYGSGSVYHKYYKDGEMYRDGDKPPVVKYNKYGNVTHEGWYKDGALHRDGDKPAVVAYNEDGSIKAEEYFKNGMKYTP